MSLDCRSVYFTGPGSVEVRVESIDLSGDELLLESELIGISHGTEMLVYRDQFPRDLPIDATFTGFDRTFAYPLKYGYSNVCTGEGGRYFAFFPHQDRFYADRADLIELPDTVTAGDGIFIPNLETAVSIVHDARPVAGETVLVIGGGVVGQLVCEVLRRSHFGGIALIEPIDARRERAASRGTEAFAPDDPALRAWIDRYAQGAGADTAIDVSGCEEGLSLAIELVRFSGTVVEASWYGTRRVNVALGSRFHRNRLTLKSSQVSNLSPDLSGRWDKRRRMKVVLDLLERIHPEYLISHTIPLSRAAEAFELIDAHPEATMQVVLDPHR